MPRNFFDTSALVKYYHVETGSARVAFMLGEGGAESLISRLAWVEVLSGLAKKVRMGALAPPGFALLQRRFRADVNDRLVRPTRALNAHFELAGRLIVAYGPSRQLRALDAIQLAVALQAHGTRPLDHFVCADQRLCEVATLEGLAVINPELSP